MTGRDEQEEFPEEASEERVGEPEWRRLASRHFDELRAIFYRRTGMLLGAQKLASIRRHVDGRIVRLGLRHPDEYLRYLRYFDSKGMEFQRLVNAVTVNETYFFRDFSQLRIFAEGCIPRLVERALRDGRANLRVLSAGCASGEEAYTLSIILKEMLEDYEGLSYEVTGVDIDDGVLASARRGIYDRRSVKDVPRIYLERHFERVGGMFTVAAPVRHPVRFFHVNIAPQGAISSLGRLYDAIFCRNVLIYFDEASRKTVLRNLFDVMLPGGYIFLGHAESLRTHAHFDVERIEDFSVYKKPGGTA